MHYPEMEQSNLVITGFSDIDSITALSVSGIRSMPPHTSPGMAQPSQFLQLGNFHQCIVSIFHLLLSLLHDPFC